MKKSHLWLFSALFILGVWIGVRWISTDSTVGTDPATETVLDAATELDEPVSAVEMSREEREMLARRGVLTNTDRPMNALIRDPAVILMRNAIIDTEIAARGGSSVDIPEAFRASGHYRRAIVVFHDPISSRQRDWLAEQGLRVEHFVPNRALAVSGPHETIRQLRDDPAVRHVEPFHPYFAMNADIQAHLTGTADAAARERATSGRYHVLLFGDPETALAQAGQPTAGRQLPELDSPGAAPPAGAFGVAGAQLRELPGLPDQAIAEVQSDPDQLAALVHSEHVKWIEPVPQFQAMNDLGRRTLRRDLVHEMRPDFDGSGQIIGVVDTGADLNDFWLDDRLVSYHRPSGVSAIDAKGHGTHVLGTILGNGARSDAVSSAPGSAGPPYDANQFHGMAPYARYVMIKDFNAYSHPEMALLAYQDGARIGNNSWGAANDFSYGIASMYWDALVKDVDWGEPVLQPYTVFFAAGNSGAGALDGTGGNPGTISQPGNAKNVITIGAIEQKRDASNLPQAPYSSLASTDSDWQVASFSGRGPTLDGRVKPDLVAPGEYVLSLQSSAVNTEILDASLGEIRDFNSGNVDTGSEYAFMSGTSRSTAFASGAGALLRQSYHNEYGSYPTPAMMKALLISGARNLHANAYEWGPKRDGSDLEIETITHEGELEPHPDMFAWWSFEGDQDVAFFNDEDLRAPEGTNLYVNPADEPAEYLEDGFPEFDTLNANPGFGQYVQFAGETVRFEMTDEAIANGWHNDPEFKVRTIEFWIRRPGGTDEVRPILAFETEEVVNPRIELHPPNLIGTSDASALEHATIYVNGASQIPILESGWNHVAIVSPAAIATTNFTLGGLGARIDEVRFYHSQLSAAQIKHNYEIGLGFLITPSSELVNQLEGMHRESVIHDGWGKLDIAGSILGAQTFDGNDIRVFDESDTLALTTGGEWLYNYQVLPTDAEGSLKVTLTWTDVHSVPGAGKKLVNDLDLRVIYQYGTDDEVIYAGNFLGRQIWGIASYPMVINQDSDFTQFSVTPGELADVGPLVLQDRRQLRFLHDRVNNVEQVIIRDLLPGTYRIEVVGEDVPVEGSEGGQPFALVVNRGVSSAGEAMGREPDLTVDQKNQPVIAYTTQDAGMTRIGVRRWIDSESVTWPDWRRMENKWFHYGDGPIREIISRSPLGAAHSPSLTFGADNTLYVAWVQENDAAGVPASIYLRYVTDFWQNQPWNGENHWQQLGSSYQGRGISGNVFPQNSVAPIVRTGWDDQPVVLYRQGTRVIVKHWDAIAQVWRGLDGLTAGVVSESAAATPVLMEIDDVGFPVVLWKDGESGSLFAVRWQGLQWVPLAGGWVGHEDAAGYSLACDAFGGVAVSWIASTDGVPSVRAARTEIGASEWTGFTAGVIDSRVHPGVCGAQNTVGPTRLAYTPKGNVLLAWLADETPGVSRVLMKKWNGANWVSVLESDSMPGLYDTIGELRQPALISDTNGFPVLAVRGVRTGQQEVQALYARADDIVDTTPIPAFPYFTWAEHPEAQQYRIVIREMTADGAPVIMDVLVDAPRHYIETQDYLDAGFTESLRSGGYQWKVYVAYEFWDSGTFIIPVQESTSSATLQPPTLSLTDAGGGQRVVSWKADSVDSDVDAVYTVQHSTDLIHWSNVSGVIEVDDENGDIRFTTDTDSSTAGQSGVYRLKIRSVR